MKIIITGASGLLGNDISEELKSSSYDVYGITLSGKSDLFDSKHLLNLDITDQNKTYELISKLNPDLVIHTAAFSNVDACQKDHVKSFKINSLGTRNICLACQRFDTVLCYISTDYVFDGEIDTTDSLNSDGYIELDKTNPSGVYGKSKYLGEFYVKHLLNKFYIVRSSWLFGKKRENFISYIIDSIKNKTPINVVEDQTGSPTYTKHLAKAILELIEKPLYGIYHITNNGGAKRIDVVNYIFQLLNKKTEIKFFKRKELFFAPRPKDSRLKNFVWELEGFKPLSHWKDAIKDFLKEINIL